MDLKYNNNKLKNISFFRLYKGINTQSVLYLNLPFSAVIFGWIIAVFVFTINKGIKSETKVDIK